MVWNRTRNVVDWLVEWSRAYHVASQVGLVASTPLPNISKPLVLKQLQCTPPISLKSKKNVNIKNIINQITLIFYLLLHHKVWIWSPSLITGDQGSSYNCEPLGAPPYNVQEQSHSAHFTCQARISGLFDIRYPAKLLTGYPAKLVSGTTLPLTNDHAMWPPFLALRT